MLLKDRARQLRAYDPSRGSTLDSYLMLVIKREVGNYLRRADAQKRGGRAIWIGAEELQELSLGSGALADPESAAVAHELGRALSRFLKKSLPPRGQRILRRIVGAGETAESVASSLGVEIQVVYNWQHRIRTLARKFLCK